MGARFEELAWASTPMGEISLRRRVEPTLGVDVFEVKLGDEFLMSSLFTASEVALARLGLAALADAAAGPAAPAAGGWDVVVGGLGLGFTARTVLEDDRVASLTVVEALSEVIGWHVDGVLPGGRELVQDPRTRLLHGDFFAMARAAGGLDPEAPGRGSTRCSSTSTTARGTCCTPATATCTASRACAAWRARSARRGVRALVRRPARAALRGGAGPGLLAPLLARRRLPQPPDRCALACTVYLGLVPQPGPGTA
jgi:hypothetical protein